MKISDKISNEILILTAQKCNKFVFFLNILCKQRCKLDVSKSVITAIRFTVGGRIIIKYSWVNKKYDEANHFLKMFPDRGKSFNGLKHLTEKVTAVASLTCVRVMVDHPMPIPLQRSIKLKISQWYFDQCLYYIKTSSSVKNILRKCFSTSFFTHIHLMRCLSSMVNLIAVTTLLLTCDLHRC